MKDETRFQDLLDAHGVDLAHWPERERSWANALLSRSESARAALRDTEKFERILMGATPDAPTDRLRREILAALPPRIIAERMSIKATTQWWHWFGGLAAATASLSLSFYLGVLNPDYVWPAESPTTVTEAEDGAIEAFDSLLLGIGFGGDSA